jgi:hypothetical protein
MTTQWRRLSEGEGADSDKPDVDCFSCLVRDAVLDFATQAYEALVRKAIVRLQRIKATGIYGDDYEYKTLWDEYCHEVQFGPHLEKEWELTLEPLLTEVLTSISPELAKLLTISALWDQVVEAAFNGAVDRQLILDHFRKTLCNVAINRDMSRFDPH